MQTPFAPALELIGPLSEKLMARGLCLGTAESCTGGLIAGACTEVPGSSRWFAGGLVVYSNALKERLLGVPPETLLEQGAVSAPVAVLMAANAPARLGAGLCLAVSGVAGPDGGTPEKPVGTVWLAASCDTGQGPTIWARCRHFAGDRAAVRLQTVVAGLALATEILDFSLARPG